MNALQRSRARCLATASMLPGSGDKRFAQDMAARERCVADGTDVRPLTERQHLYMAKLCYKYRRQLPSDVCPRRDPVSMTPDELAKEMRADPPPEKKEDARKPAVREGVWMERPHGTNEPWRPVERF